jgi:hypothetical protein
MSSEIASDSEDTDWVRQVSGIALAESLRIIVWVEDAKEAQSWGTTYHREQSQEGNDSHHNGVHHDCG